MTEEIEMYIYVWDESEFNYECVHAGARGEVPEEYRESVALIDASDKKEVHGVGDCVQEMYYLDKEYTCG